jgi:hypothetical protein
LSPCGWRLVCCVKTIDAILALGRRGLPMLKAKRRIETALNECKVVLTIPMVESVGAMANELRDAGFEMEQLAAIDRTLT